MIDFELFCCDEQIFYSNSIYLTSEIWKKDFRKKKNLSIWEKILTIREYVDNKLNSLCDNSVNIWDIDIIYSQFILKKVLCYLDKEKSDNKQIVDYINLLLASRFESSIKKFEIWSQKLKLILRSISTSLLKFLRRLLNPKSRLRIKVEDYLLNI